jgi:hypothetical protein
MGQAEEKTGTRAGQGDGNGILERVVPGSEYGL